MAPVAVPTLEDLSISEKKEEKKPDVVDNEDEEGDEEDDVEGDDAPESGDAKKKKKKKKSKKKKSATVTQSEPPRVGLSKIYKNGVYPIAEEVEYKNDTTSRITSAEMREKERLAQEDPSTRYSNIRKGGEVHRQVRSYVQKNIKPGMKMTEIAEMVENGTRALVEENGFESGIGFPTGLSVNEVAAHYTPNPGDNKILQKGDVLKVDFGVHVNGRIVDSAFTMNFGDPSWDKLLEAVKDATNTGISEAGIDVRLCDIGERIQEVMESYEVEVNGKTYPVKSMTNLNGHSITPYSIHGARGDLPGKSVPIVKQHGSNIDTQRMEEGEYFAIETFGSTGNGRVEEQGACSHYALAQHAPERYTGHHQSAKTLLASIKRNFGSLPFCRRYLEHVGEKNYLLALNTLVKEGIVLDYPPLVDLKPGAMTAQFEHTILLRPTCKEVVSRGDDY
ncbi:methionine aminopeptidase, type II [Kwoniella mangroviensis CBS 8507]|uniref:methionine aminopeptidase, type II n=1 Tax=Kwoniella mangroviensis CBS 8507 TaxID=1296122 RepID=UPI00080D7BCC|nr:methionine aminopeptidase, type II [Kwoniella mangroviensis CBS 8507]OCF64420.1 methionine aminopeptidase, type II [Kwoniella mangroviensis CBS 8507]